MFRNLLVHRVNKESTVTEKTRVRTSIMLHSYFIKSVPSDNKLR